MRKTVIASVLTGSVLAAVLYAQTRGVPGQLRVSIDSTGALVTVSAAQVLPLSSCTFSNCRLLLDSQGRLVTTDAGGGSDFTDPVFINSYTLQGDFGDVVHTQLDVTGGSSSPHEDEELVFMSRASGNVMALRNDSTTGYSALSFRNDGNVERTVVGYANSSDAGNPFNLGGYVETQPGDASAAAGLVPFRVMQDGNFGAIGMGFRFYRRTTWESDGDISTWRLIPFGTTQIQTSIIKNDGTGVGIGAGAGTPLAQVHISEDTANNPFAYIDNYGGVPSFIGRQAAGSLASPTATTVNVTMARFAARPYLDNAAFKTTDTAAINLIATEAQTTTANGSRIDFRVTANASTTLATVARFGPQGLEVAGFDPTVANVGANSCGTTTATILGKNNAGRVTVGGTSGTQCRITTVGTAANTWDGSCSNTTTAALCRFVPVSATTFDLVGTFTAGDVLSYLAIAR